MVQLNLDSFSSSKELNNEDRINITLSSSLHLKDCSDNEIFDVMQVIFEHYVMGKGGIFHLKDEYCKHCKHKLKRKGTVEKVYHFPGGHQMVLHFMRYSCKHCDKTPDKPYEAIFEKNKHYSSNIKADSVRKYIRHLSSYDAVKDEINKEYGAKISKRTIRRWVNEIAKRSTAYIFSNNGFSGHLVYDEEFMSVFEGDVGIRGATLIKKRLYFHLFRDAKTNSVFIFLSDSLEKENLKKIWLGCFVHMIKLGITPLTISTDGLSDYSDIIKEINTILISKGLINKPIRHSYCCFHFQTNTYDNAKRFIFESQFSKKELPVYVIDQIKLLHEFFKISNVEDSKKHLAKLLYEIKTFIEPLQVQIKRLDKYFKEYTLHKEFPFLKTTNHAEQYFSNTKPEKIKKGYKTEFGLKCVLNNIGVRMMCKDWLHELGIRNDFSAAMFLFTKLIKGLKART